MDYLHAKASNRRQEVHRGRKLGSVRVEWLVAGVGAGFVLVVIFGAIALRSMSNDVPVEPLSGRIAFTSFRDGDDEIYVMNADGSEIQQLTDNDYNDIYPVWSPDGTSIGFTSNRDNDLEEVYDIYVMNADGSGVQQLTDSKHGDWFDAWSPDGDRIALTSGGEIYVMNADGSDVKNLTDNNPPSSGGYIFFWDRDGDGYGEPYLRKPDGSFEIFANWDSDNWDAIDWDAINALNWDHFDGDASWSPNGGRITFSSGRDGDFEIYVMNADGSGVVQLTDNNTDDSDPALSPDGRRIAFSSTRDGNRQIYVMNADGSGALQLTDDKHDNRDPAWSPNGSRIAFESNRGGGDASIYVMDEDGSDVERLTVGFSPTWSPVLD